MTGALENGKRLGMLRQNGVFSDQSLDPSARGRIRMTHISGATRIVYRHCAQANRANRYSTVTDFARLRGLSTSVPRHTAMWYARSCMGTAMSIGLMSSEACGT